MKNKVLILFALLLSASFTLTAQSKSGQVNPVGRWKFEAPYAPEGYTSGIIEVTFADNKYSGSMSFTGNDYKIPCEKTVFEKDTLLINLNVDGNEVSVNLKMNDANKMSGNALYSGGEIPLTLTREKKDK